METRYTIEINEYGDGSQTYTPCYRNASGLCCGRAYHALSLAMRKISIWKVREVVNTITIDVTDQPHNTQMHTQ